MRNLIKTTTVCSLLIVACFLISACGSGGTENFVQGKGKIVASATNSATGLPLAGVQIQVRKNSVTDPTVISNGTTDSTGNATFEETIATDYFFSFSATGFAPQNYVNNPVQSALTTTKNITVAMVPL